ncbi:hypothetical protein GF373_06390 [bacterium]|nr:hypothetical protein [bacterium]
MKKYVWMIAIGMVLSLPAFAQDIGIFTDRQDIGEPNLESIVAKFENGTYTMEAVGATIGRRSIQDQFHYIYKEISGSFAIEGEPIPILPDGEGGFMIRQDLDPDSIHASFLRVGDAVPGGNTNAAYGTVFPHFRTVKGGGTLVDGDVGNGGYTDDNFAGIRMERIGNSIHLYTENIDGDWVLSRTVIVPMTEQVYVGMAATANGADLLGEFEFENVAIEEFPLWVERSIPVDAWEGGSTITVTITAKTRGSSSVDAVVTEVVPRLAPFTSVNVSDGSFTTNERKGEIEWDLGGFSGEATMTYDITLPDRDSGSWQGTFSDGVNADGYIGGDTVLPKNPVVTPYESPIDLDPDKPVVLQAERGILNEEQPEQLLLMVDPKLDSGQYLINSGGGIAGWVSFPVNIPAGYGDIYIFGNTLGFDGNSDSFFVAIDGPPENEDTNIWDFGSGPNWHIDWVNNRADEDPRPFTGFSGEATIYLANREDSSCLDWIAITNDPDFAPGAFDALTGEIYDPLTELEGFDTENLGIFDASMDIWDDIAPENNGKPGGAGYDAATGTYIVIGGGNDVWNEADNFHYLYKELSGDFSLQATLELDPATSGDTWVKGMLMARNELLSSASYVSTRMRPDGQYSAQWRPDFAMSSSSTDGGERVGFEVHDGTFKLERVDGVFHYYYADKDTGELVEMTDTNLAGGENVFLEDPLYVGLGVTSHEVTARSIGYFTNVTLTTDGQPVPVDEWFMY